MLDKSEKETLIYLINEEIKSLPNSPVGDVLKDSFYSLRKKIEVL